MSAKLPPVKPPSRGMTQLSSRREKTRSGKQAKGVLRTVVVDDATSKFASLGSFKKTSSSHKEHCLHLLVSGYPRAYVEFFELTDGTTGEKQVREDEQLMLLLRSNLATCEDLTREGKLADAVVKRTHLAKIFKEHGVVLHAQHHLGKAEALAVRSKDVRLIVDARRELGALFEQQDKLEAAVKSYTAQLDALEESTLPDTEQRLITAWRDLARTLLALAKQQAAQDSQRALHTIQSAQRFAVKGDDTTQLVPIFLEGGAIHEQCRLVPQAIDYYNKFLTKRRAMGAPSDGSDQARACLGLARCHEEQGDLDLARQYLESLAVLCERTGQTALATETCTRLGTLVARLDDFSAADEWFGKAMKLARQLNDLGLLNEIQVKAGIAQSHSVMPKVIRCLESNTKQDLLNLLEWSFSRQGL